MDMEVFSDTFENLGIEIIQVGMNSGNPDNLNILVELSGNDKFTEFTKIKANAYDKNGQILATTYACLDPDDFGGYDTLEVIFNDDDILARTSKVRLFATR